MFFNHGWSIAVEVQTVVLIFAILKYYVLRPIISHTKSIEILRVILERLRTVFLIFLLIKILSVLFVFLVSGTPVIIPFHSFDWIDPSSQLSVGVHRFLQLVYLPVWTRFLSHLIGASMAILWIVLQREELKETRRKIVSLCGSNIVLLASVTVSLIVVFCWTYAGQEGQVSAFPFWWDVGMFMFGRSLFCMGIAVPLMAMLLSLETPKQTEGEEVGILLRISHRFLSLSVWRPISQISFAGYIYHIPVIAGVMMGIGIHISQNPQDFEQPFRVTQSLFFQLSVLGVILGLGSGFITHYLIEKPIAKLFQRWRLRNRIKTA